MASQSQLDLLLELYGLEKTLKSGKGKAKREAELRCEEICSKIEARVLKHYLRHETPFGEFRDRTCLGCGMVYPETHIHCRPKSDVIRLCESCGRILVDAGEAGTAGREPAKTHSLKKPAKAVRSGKAKT